MARICRGQRSRYCEPLALRLFLHFHCCGKLSNLSISNAGIVKHSGTAIVQMTRLFIAIGTDSKHAHILKIFSGPINFTIKRCALRTCSRFAMQHVYHSWGGYTGKPNFRDYSITYSLNLNFAPTKIRKAYEALCFAVSVFIFCRRSLLRSLLRTCPLLSGNEISRTY